MWLVLLLVLVSFGGWGFYALNAKKAPVQIDSFFERPRVRLSKRPARKKLTTQMRRSKQRREISSRSRRNNYRLGKGLRALA